VPTRPIRDCARLCALAEVGGCAVDPESVSVRSNEAAACHLFRVAAGLESIVLGDTHVAAQVRQAHNAAKHAGTTGPLLDRLFESASRASKRVRTQDRGLIGRDVDSGARGRDRRVHRGPLADRRVLVVGAGRMARVAALNAWSRGCHDIAVVNRTLARANALAVRVGGAPPPSIVSPLSWQRPTS
jgi:glutamyl-tRNA reductase